jgi:cobalt/nickel transport protein
MKRYENLFIVVAVILMVALPLLMIQKPAPGPDGKEVLIFRGADDHARDLIGTIAPGYQPWFKPVMEPPSGEIASLLFSLQAALGAGFIGYYLGSAATRARMLREVENEQKC